MNEFLFRLLKPIYAIAASIGGLISFLLGALADPQGWMNSFVIKTVDVVAVFLPSTPEKLKVSSILDSIGDSMPLVGKSIVYEIAGTIASIAAISIIIKIYKLIPLKAT